MNYWYWTDGAVVRSNRISARDACRVSYSESMATKKKAEKETAADSGEKLQTAAKAIGSALGTIAAKTGLAGAPKRGKFVSKGKKRVPRKDKKIAKKAAARKA